MALHGGPLRSNPDHGYRAQRALPPHFPGMATLTETNLGPCTISALSDGVPMQCEAILLDVDIPGAIICAEGVLESAYLKAQGIEQKNKLFSPPKY